jgi:hypothetical protein
MVVLLAPAVARTRKSSGLRLVGHAVHDGMDSINVAVYIKLVPETCVRPINSKCKTENEKCKM